MEKKINYLARTFNDIKSELIGFSNKYYPEISDSFNDSSVGSWLIDMVSAVGDDLSYHTDRMYQENNPNSATLKNSVINSARSNGVKIPGPKPSMCEVELSCTIPVNNIGNISEPKWSDAPIVKMGSIVGNSDYYFEITEDVDFAEQFNSDGYSNRKFSANRDNNGQIISYTISKSIVVSSGRGKVYKKVINSEELEPFMEIVLPEKNIMNVESVIFKEGTSFDVEPKSYEYYIEQEEVEVNGEGNKTYRFFEVDSLSDQYVFGSKSTLEGDDKISIDSVITPSQLVRYEDVTDNNIKPKPNNISEAVEGEIYYSDNGGGVKFFKRVANDDEKDCYYELVCKNLPNQNEKDPEYYYDIDDNGTPYLYKKGDDGEYSKEGELLEKIDDAPTKDAYYYECSNENSVILYQGMKYGTKYEQINNINQCQVTTSKKSKTNTNDELCYTIDTVTFDKEKINRIGDDFICECEFKLNRGIESITPKKINDEYREAAFDENNKEVFYEQTPNFKLYIKVGDKLQEINSGCSIIDNCNKRVSRYYLGEWKAITQKFITEYTDNGYLKLIFGSGTMPFTNVGDNYTEYAKHMLTKLVNNDLLGVLPHAGWIMYVLYRVGGGVHANLAPGAINTIIKSNLYFPNSEIDTSVKSSITNSLSVKNLSASVGGKDMPSIEEIKYLTKYSVSAKNRCVTLKDYKNVLMSIPPKYGCPFRCNVIEANNKIVISCLGINLDGTLDMRLPEPLRENIITYLSHYKTLGDYIEIRSGKVYNLGFKVNVFIDKTYVPSDVIKRVIETVKNYMDVSKHDMGEDIFLGDLEKEINMVDGVISLIDMNVYSIYDGDLSYACQLPKKTIYNPETCLDDIVPFVESNKNANNSFEIDLDKIDSVLLCDYDSMYQISKPKENIIVQTKIR